MQSSKKQAQKDQNSKGKNPGFKDLVSIFNYSFDYNLNF
jgi:hypothetical protein